jgi:hypothetical protein
MMINKPVNFKIKNNFEVDVRGAYNTLLVKFNCIPWLCLVNVSVKETQQVQIPCAGVLAPHFDDQRLV